MNQTRTATADTRTRRFRSLCSRLVAAMAGALRPAGWLLGAGAWLLTGCAGVDPQPSLQATRRLVGDPAGERVFRLDGATAQAAAEARARQLLASPLTIDSAGDLALLRSPRLQATLQDLGVAQADLAQATRLANPRLALSRLSGDGDSRRSGSLTADLADWLVLPLRRRLSEAEVERTRLRVGAAILATVAEARAAVVRHQAAVRLADRLAAVEELEGAAADYADALHEAGNLTALERAQARAEWAESSAELRRARVEVTRSREAAGRALGLAATEDWTVAAGPPPPGAAVVGDEETAVARRLDLAAARWAVSALERAVVLKRRTRLLPVGIEAGVEREREGDGFDVSGPVVELRLPLFDTGRASLARLEAELAAARWQLVALEAAVRSQVRVAAAELEAGRELVALYDDTILPLRREVLERALREYNQMLIGTFDLLLAKRSEVEAERRAVAALESYWQARIALERAVGSPLGAALEESIEPPPAGAAEEHDHAAPENGGKEHDDHP